MKDGSLESLLSLLLQAYNALAIYKYFRTGLKQRGHPSLKILIMDVCVEENKLPAEQWKCRRADKWKYSALTVSSTCGLTGISQACSKARNRRMIHSNLCHFGFFKRRNCCGILSFHVLYKNITKIPFWGDNLSHRKNQVTQVVSQAPQFSQKIYFWWTAISFYTKTAKLN